jgi:hypothetical protein
LAGLVPVQDGYDNERGDQGDRAESDDELSDEEEQITHAVPFKCIGAAHEKNYQHHLEKAYLTHHEQDKPVNVRIRAEPLNPRDPRAIAIDLDYGTGWTNVGYIASELRKYLQPIIAAGNILDVYVQHIKYRVDFLK